MKLTAPWKIAIVAAIAVVPVTIGIIRSNNKEKAAEAKAIENGLVENRLVIVDVYFTEFKGQKFRHITLVNPNTGVMYVETNHGIQELHDEDDNPLIYEGQLP